MPPVALCLANYDTTGTCLTVVLYLRSLGGLEPQHHDAPTAFALARDTEVDPASSCPRLASGE